MTNKLLNLFSLISLIILLTISGCTKEWPTDPPDVTRPEITNTFPVSGSILVAANSPVQITFTEAMDLATISTNATVSSIDSETVNGTWAENGNIFTFTPQNPFKELTAYNITIKGAFDSDGNWLGPTAKDQKGNSLYNDYVFNFATLSNIQNTTLYFGRGPEWEYDQSGAQKGIGCLTLSNDASNGEIIVETIGNFPPGQLNLAFNPSRDKIYVADYTGKKVWLLDPVTKQLGNSIDVPISPTFITFTPNGEELWILGKDDGLVFVVNTNTNQVVGELDLSGTALNSMAINNAGTIGYITTGGSNSGSVIIVDIPNRTVITTIEDIILNGQDYAFTNDIFVSQDDSRVYFFNNYASPHIRIINTVTNTIDGEITFPAGGSDDEWIPFKNGNLIYAMARWGSGGFKIDLTSNSIAAQHSLEEANCYLGAMIDPDNEVVYAIGNPSWDTPANGIFSVLRASDLKKIITLKTINNEGIDLPWRYMLAN
jgi:hypothetical protein